MNIQRQNTLLAVTALFLLTIGLQSCGSKDDPPPPPPDTVPSAPTGVSAILGDRQVTISWDSVSGATSYNVYSASVSGVTPANYNTLAGGTKHTGVSGPFVATGLVNGTTYYFVVTAVNGVGESVESTEVSATPNLSPAPPTALSWKSIGPGGGDIEAIVVSPDYATDHTLFIATSFAGVFRSTDGGNSWTPLNSNVGLYSIKLRRLTISPAYATDHTLFISDAASGDFFLLKSTSGGNSWSTISRPDLDPITALAISQAYATDHTLIAGTGYGGVLKSTDGGNTWTAINSGLPIDSITKLYPFVRALAISTNYVTDHTLFVGTENGVFRSTDGGQSWAGINPTFSVPQVKSVSSLAVSPAFATDHTLFMATAYNGTFRSTDGGNTWTAINFGLRSKDGLPLSVNTLVVSPAYVTDHTLFAGTPSEGGPVGNKSGGVFKSTDGGDSWSAINSGLTDIVGGAPGPVPPVVAVSPAYEADHTLFAGIGFSFSGGVFRSVDGGSSWASINAGLNNLYTNSVAVSPNYAADHTLFVGISLNNWVYRSTDGGNSWTQIAVDRSVFHTGPTGPSPTLAFSPAYATDHTLFAGGSFKLFKSTDNGNTWTNSSSGLPTVLGLRSLGISPDYATDRTLFAGTWLDGVFRSTDGGSSWIAINSGFSIVNGFGDYPTVEALAMSPAYATDHTLFAGGDGVFKSTDGGNTWTTSSSGIPISDGVLSLAISPNYVTDHTLFAGTGSGVFRSTDGGSTWTAINSVLSSQRRYIAPYVHGLVVSPAYATDHTLFAGTADGVFRSTDGGNTWTAFSSGMPSTKSGQFLVPISALAISSEYATDHTLFAATMGFSIWESNQ